MSNNQACKDQGKAIVKIDYRPRLRRFDVLRQCVARTSHLIIDMHMCVAKHLAELVSMAYWKTWARTRSGVWAGGRAGGHVHVHTGTDTYGKDGQLSKRRALKVTYPSSTYKEALEISNLQPIAPLPKLWKLVHVSELMITTCEMTNIQFSNSRIINEHFC